MMIKLNKPLQKLKFISRENLLINKVLDLLKDKEQLQEKISNLEKNNNGKNLF